MRLIAVAPAVIALVTASTAYAGPCSAELAHIEQQIAADNASVSIGPSAPQSVGAQLGHQPTPETVQNAEHQAGVLGQAAFDRARNADGAGNAPACRQALGEVKELYGIP
jgi:hypothetical protein